MNKKEKIYIETLKKREAEHLRTIADLRDEIAGYHSCLLGLKYGLDNLQAGVKDRIDDAVKGQICHERIKQ